VSLVLGLLSFCTCGLTAPFAIWTGVMSNRQSGKNGLATAGIVLGVAACAVVVVVLLLNMVGLYLTSPRFLDQ